MLTRARRRPGVITPETGFGPSVSVVGWITGLDAEGRASVDFDGNAAGPLPARCLVRCSAAELAAAGPKPAVLLGFEGLDTSRPIILGLLHEHLAKPPAATPMVARLDGRRVELTAQQELVLRCGRASITMHADGTIVIKGGELHSRASGRNRITGSTVAIN
jgi:hypothetical protein